MGKLELENIFTFDVLKYCEMVGKQLSDYKPVGVYYCDHFNEYETACKAIYGFVKHIPEEAEAVVNFEEMWTIKSQCIYAGKGIALIPKDNSDRHGDSGDNNLVHPKHDQDKN